MKNSSERLQEGLKDLNYPDSMAKVEKTVAGTAFFPVGNGTVGNETDPSKKKIMILGQDFDTGENYKKVLKADKEDMTKNATWRNLLHFLKSVGITPEDCFFTNAIMGVRKEGKGTGKSPAFKDEDFIKQCQEFFKAQMKMQKPQVVFVLGKEVAHFLAPLSNDLNHWKRIKSFASNDSEDKGQIMEAKVGDVRSTFVLLTHPSYRNSNVHRRSYKGLAGNDAEKKMAKDAVAR